MLQYQLQTNLYCFVKYVPFCTVKQMNLNSENCSVILVLLGITGETYLQIVVPVSCFVLHPQRFFLPLAEAIAAVAELARHSVIVLLC